MSKISFFNTNSPKGCGNFGIGQTDLELVFLACISIKHFNLIGILDVSHELKKIWHAEIDRFFAHFYGIWEIISHYLKTLKFRFHIIFKKQVILNMCK